MAEANQQTTDWETWVRLEASTRTKFVAYCFFNLCSIAYNTPPLLLTSEIHLYLPNPSRLWQAESAWQWQEARQSYPNIEISLQEAFARLLNRGPSQAPPASLTALGNYILIHAVVQHIFLLKQTSLSTMTPFGVQRGLKMEDVEDINQALRAWSLGFDQHRQLRANEMAAHGTGEGYTEGPVAFNSTALLRLAYIRLHTDLSPSRSLETRDHVMIARAFSDAPLLVRSARLCRAVVQAIHALSMLVKMGVNYVAKTKSLEWSMQHSCKSSGDVDPGADWHGANPSPPQCAISSVPSSCPSGSSPSRQSARPSRPHQPTRRTSWKWSAACWTRPSLPCRSTRPWRAQPAPTATAATTRGPRTPRRLTTPSSGN